MSVASLYTIPPHQPFAQTLVKGLLNQATLTGIPLHHTFVLLPTRRACRAVREAFLQETNGKPLLLPRLQPLGDIDAEELYLTVDPDIDLSIPPAITPIKRQLLLARLIAARENGGGIEYERHLPLAKALGSLMDQIYTENLSLSSLPHLVKGTDFADHWQITVDFLTILSEHWPRILETEGVIDAADRRNRLMNMLAEHWERQPPPYSVIAAGSTGSIPATGRLLKVIAFMPNGAVVLPGLDQIISEEDWAYVREGHPQATLKNLLTLFKVDRAQVQPWLLSQTSHSATRTRLASEVMRPAETADRWQKLAWTQADRKASVSNLHYIEAETSHDEADKIAFLLREILEEGGKTALVITPDRTLAARITTSIARWGIQLDDSAGQPLIHTPATRFFLSLAEMITQGLKPSLLLATLKHDLCRAPFSPEFVSQLETELLRGLTPPPGPVGLIQYYETKLADPRVRRKPKPIREDLDHLNELVSPFYMFMQQPTVSLEEALERHITLAERLAGDGILWRDDDGVALADFLSQLRKEVQGVPNIKPQDYPLFLKELIKGQTIRPAYGTHPRLSVMGQLEARLIHADRLILAGLNEGTWPPDTGTDPFLSRPMKHDFGLPPPERAVGLSAHDFVQGFCAGEVYLTRAKKADGAPTIPARWISRLDTVLTALGTSLASLHRPELDNWRETIQQVGSAKPVIRPSPRPEIDIRPACLSVTKIETWLKDPYSVYAQYILELDKLKPLEQETDAAIRGTLIHEILEKFVAHTAELAHLPANAEDLFLKIAKETLPRHVPAEADQALLWPKIIRIAQWFIPQESRWRTLASPGLREVHTTWQLQPGNRPFVLSGIADRIDHLKTGTAALIDYKSGGASLYTPGGIKSGKLPQLPLEALMLKNGAFADKGISLTKTGTLSYWIASGGKTPGDVKEINDEGQIDASVSAVESALYDLITAYEKPETPYYALPMLSRAPRYNDYAHLSRVQEWTALDEGEDVA